jgi:hypothetical protein
MGRLTGNPAFDIDKPSKKSPSTKREEDRDAKFMASYAVVGELILIATALDYQLNHILIQVLHLTESPMLESVIATLDMARKIEMLRARTKHIVQNNWKKPILAHLEKLEKISRWRNIAAHTALIPHDEHGAAFAPAAAAKLLKSFQIGDEAPTTRIPVSDLKPIIRLAESALYEGEQILKNFRKINAERIKRFGR